MLGKKLIIPKKNSKSYGLPPPLNSGLITDISFLRDFFQIIVGKLLPKRKRICIQFLTLISYLPIID